MKKNTLLKALNLLLDAQCAALLEQLEPLEAALRTQNARIREVESHLQSALTQAPAFHPEREIARQHYLATLTPRLEQARTQVRALATEESLLNTQHRQHAIRKKLLERLAQKHQLESLAAARQCAQKQLDEWVVHTWRHHEHY